VRARGGACARARERAHTYTYPTYPTLSPAARRLVRDNTDAAVDLAAREAAAEEERRRVRLSRPVRAPPGPPWPGRRGLSPNAVR